MQQLFGSCLSSRAVYQKPFPNLPDAELEPELNFYDTTVEAFASKEIQTFTLAQVPL